MAADRIKVSTEVLEKWTRDLDAVQSGLSGAQSILSAVSLTKDNTGELRLQTRENLSNGALIAGEDIEAFVRSLGTAMKRTEEDAREIATGVSRAAEVFEDAENSIDKKMNGIGVGEAAPKAFGVGSGTTAGGSQDAAGNLIRHIRKLIDHAREILKLIVYFNEHPDPGPEAQKERDEALRTEIRDVLNGGEFSREAWEKASPEEKKEILKKLIPALNGVYNTNVSGEIDFFDGGMQISDTDREIAELGERIGCLEEKKKNLQNRMNDPENKADIPWNVMLDQYDREIENLQKNLEELEKRRKCEVILTAGEYDDANRRVRINNYALENYSYEEIMEVVAHEMRHAYQHEAIRNPGEYDVSKETLITWSNNFYNYKDTDKTGVTYEDYRNQPVEEDAFVFSEDIV